MTAPDRRIPLDHRYDDLVVDTKPLRALRSVPSANERLRSLREEALRRPEALVGLKQPAIETIWAYAKGLTDAIDEVEGRSGEPWARFLREERGFGSRTEYRVLLDDYAAFDDRLRFLRDLYAAYDRWLGQPDPRAGGISITRPAKPGSTGAE